MLLLPDQQHVLSASQDWTIRKWDLESGCCVGVFEGHQNQVDVLLSLPERGRFLSAGADQKIKEWDIKSGRCVHTYDGPNGHQGCISSLLLMPDGKHFLSSCGKGEIKKWSLEENGNPFRYVQTISSGKDLCLTMVLL